MKFYQSIRFRIGSYILVFGVLLVVLNSGITFFVMEKGFSRLVENLLSTEAEYFLLQYAQDKNSPLPHSKYIKMYQGISAIPEPFRENVKSLGPGIHEIFRDKSKRPMHVAVLAVPDTEIPYYMFFHGKEFSKDTLPINPHEIALISLFILLVPGTLIGYIISKMLYAPMVRLRETIKTLNPDKIPDQLSGREYTNEIGLLTRTIENTMNRIKEFIAREKQFTRDASHELRTPVTIIKGAVEIMEQQPELEANPLLANPLKRISRSVKDMETLIETFLWLAREESEPEDTCLVEPVVRKALLDNQYLIADKNIDLRIEIHDDKSIRVREEILYIAVTNLIRNAFHFTANGSVTITIDDVHIGIQDTGMGIETDRIDSVTLSHVKGDQSQGFGLGLSIVSRLCKRFGWELTIESQPGKWTRARIFWQNT